MLPMKVWDEQEKRMWFVQSLHIEDEWIRANDGSIYGEQKDLVRNFKLLYPTAQTDKNGQPIYQGDIVKVDNHPLQTKDIDNLNIKVGMDINGLYVVEYIEEEMAFVIGDLKPRAVIRHAEVVGNIYETPHLLEGES
ncbi:YopX family protein [Staphylococcus haemolyticus]|uniref:YopX family protein n=1 Tax=Staphylococcus haemolyticus TaxID=1283 RepID=UPI001F0AB8D1|nr:YopX family protein [Staphylococcus haemolyticus]MCH4501194.1 YopX family protein [Staphylococcus haemolyticus]